MLGLWAALDDVFDQWISSRWRRAALDLDSIESGDGDFPKLVTVAMVGR